MPLGAWLVPADYRYASDLTETLPSSYHRTLIGPKRKVLLESGCEG